MKGSTVKRMRKDGTPSYAAVFRAVDPKTGRTRQVWKSGFATKAAAEKAVKEAVREADKAGGVYGQPTKDTVEEFLTKQWLPAKRSKLRPNTFSMYSSTIDSYIVPAIGALQLRFLTPGRLNALYGDLLDHGRRRDGSGLSERSVEIVHVVLRKSLADAVKWKLLPANPADDADRPKGRTREAAAWASEEVRAFLDSVQDDRLSAMWRLFAMTGMRRGEVLGLRWKDVDLDGAKVTVAQTVVLVDHQIVIAEGAKTDSSRRTISVDPETVTTLRAHRRRQAEERLAWGPAWTNGGLVFTREDGTALHPERVTKWFEQRRKKADLPRLTLHGLRHSHATALLRGGVPIAVVSKRLGHKTIAVTLGVYAHALPGDDEAAAVIGARLLGGAG